MSTRRKIASVSLDFYHFDPPWPALNCSPQSKFLGSIILNLRQKPMRSINSSFSIPNMHDICREKERTFSVEKKWQISHMILHCPSFRKSSSLLKGLMLDPHQNDKRSLFAFSTRSVWHCGLKCSRGEEKPSCITLSRGLAHNCFHLSSANQVGATFEIVTHQTELLKVWNSNCYWTSVVWNSMSWILNKGHFFATIACI